MNWTKTAWHSLGNILNMRKSDKKTDNQLREVLSDVCETTLKGFTGFQWLTHLVNYSAFPKSLKVICVFDTKLNLNGFMTTSGCDEISTLIQKNLFDIGISIKSNQISYDTEDNFNRGK
jgi:hypothetical protein